MRLSLQKNYFILFILLIFTAKFSTAQKIGVVFSGGGAAGYAHIGVLKALEENNIPVDYITGTSQGALIGSMYALGYSPTQIEAFVKTESYIGMTVGATDEKYAYYFKNDDNDPSWISFKLSLDSALKLRLPTNIVNPLSLDFGLLEFTTGPSAAAKYDFDSLFIPFRCVAADVHKKETVIMKSGDLGQAVRSSIAYPFFIPPVAVDGRLLYDGGFYNNFPSNIMYEDFYPDFIIGSTVAANIPPADEDNIVSQIKCMLLGKTNFDVPCEAGLIIKPKTNVSLFDFSDPQPTIDSGYVATMRQMDFIKAHVVNRITPEELKAKRAKFRAKIPEIVFDNIFIEGLNSKQAEYARRILRQNSKQDTKQSEYSPKLLRNNIKQVSMEEIKEGYFRLASDNKIKYIYPQAKFNPQSGFYDLYLKVKKERDIITYFGGNFSNRPISQGYLGVQYNYLDQFAAAITANVYFGKLYNSAQIQTRFDFPFRTPIYVEPSVTWNKWDYFSSSSSFLKDVKPAYLKQNEQYANVKIGFPTGKKGRMVLGAGSGRITDKYYQTTQFTEDDTTDRTDFDMFNYQGYYEINSLNRKQYANQGSYVNIKLLYVNGLETNTPGSTSINGVNKFKKYHEWVTFKTKAERYFNRRGTLKIGLFGEGVYSTKTLFNNFTASVLSAPAFQPTPDSKTIFLENYRAHQYLAGGLKFVVNFRENIEFRAEGYVFQPVQSFIKTAQLKTDYSSPFALQHYIATGAIVWSTPIGPLSLSVNYYDQEKKPFSVLFHFGYIMFNKRAIE
ncbi:MAG: patatin-like phospholipase family protein [Bacteroidetes bacterium]|nr:patatin-like phospholipase family protein [Bacteroidota bacterium]